MTFRRFATLPVALAVASFLPPAAPGRLAAQEPGDVRNFTFTTGRPRIGVMLDVRGDPERDRLGARIESVTPDGPADKAGLKAGDIITRFNGTALGGARGDDAEASGPARKLMELARKLEPGDTVDIEYRRDGETKKTKIVARDLEGTGLARRFRVQVPPMDMQFERSFPRMPMELDGGHGDFSVFVNEDAVGLHLADLNPELGEYFGAKQGVLVLETPKDSTVPLRAGDVIVTIDGRAPTSEAHAQRILRSYDAGETAKLEILRKQKKVTVMWKVPERDWKWRTPAPKGRIKIERS